MIHYNFKTSLSAAFGLLLFLSEPSAAFDLSTHFSGPNERYALKNSEQLDQQAEGLFYQYHYQHWREYAAGNNQQRFIIDDQSLYFLKHVDTNIVKLSFALQKNQSGIDVFRSVEDWSIKYKTGVSSDADYSFWLEKSQLVAGGYRSGFQDNSFFGFKTDQGVKFLFLADNHIVDHGIVADIERTNIELSQKDNVAAKGFYIGYHHSGYGLYYKVLQDANVNYHYNALYLSGAINSSYQLELDYFYKKLFSKEYKGDIIIDNEFNGAFSYDGSQETARFALIKASDDLKFYLDYSKSLASINGIFNARALPTTFESLLGLGRVSADAELTTRQLGIEKSWHFSHYLLKPSISYGHADFQGISRYSISYFPAGIAAKEENSFDINGLDYLVLKLGLSYRQSSFDLTYSMQQMVPLRIYRSGSADDSASISENDRGSGSSVSLSELKGLPDGHVQTLSVSVYF